MKGCQFAVLIACAAPTMKTSTTATLMITMTLFTLADSLIPITRSVVTRAMMMTAGRLKIAVTWVRLDGSVPAPWIWLMRASLTAVQPALRWRLEASDAGTSIRLVPRAAASEPGTLMPMSRRNDTTYPDHPMATVTAPSAYSRIRSRSEE